MPADVKGGFFAQYGATLTEMQGIAPNRRLIAQKMGTQGLVAEREILRTLDGAVAGAVATKTRARITNSTELGGLRTVENVNLVNRATTAADVTRTKRDLLSLSAITTMASPFNGDRNPLGTR